MRIRKFDATTDWAMVEQWWLAHRWPPIPPPILSTFGVVVGAPAGEDWCAGWLYRTDSKIGWIEWLVSNPKATSTNVHDGLVMLIDVLKAESKRRGDMMLFGALKTRGLIRLYKNLGFQETDSGMTHMVLTW